MLQGYVHDMGSAMLGGVCGHAGLFGNSKVGLDKLESAFTGGKLDSITDQLKEQTAGLQNQVKDIAGNIDTGALQSGLQDATGGLQSALGNFGGFGG